MAYSRDSTLQQFAHPRLLLAWAIWLCIVPPAIALTMAGIPARLRDLRANIPAHAEPILAIEIGLALVFFVTALFVTWKRPRDLVALFLALTLTALGAVETSLTHALISPDWSDMAWLWRWPVLALRAIEMSSALILLYVFPDGRFTPNWTRPLALIWAALNVAWLIFPDMPFSTVYGETWRRTPLASLLFGAAWFSSGIIALIARYLRITDPIQRRQTWWIAAGLIAAVLGGIAYYGLQVLEFGLELRLLGDTYFVARPAVQALGMALLPLCLAVAILRYRLFNIEIIVNLALVHGMLTLFVIGAYIGVVTALSSLFHSDGNLLFSLIATGLVAMLFQPLRLRLQRMVDRLIYGARHEPYAVLAGLGRRLEMALAPEAVLMTILETICTTLKLPYAAIERQQNASSDAGGEILAAYRPTASDGARQQATWRFPMIHRGEVIGYLLVAPRSSEAGFRADEQRLLSDLARQAGSALHTLQLTLDLRRSRERIVAAREEERRRIRRDLHDGIGPTLASIAQRIGMAHTLLARNPEHSARLLGELEEQVRTLLADIRRLVYALRPPALDQYGLVEAIRLETERLAGSELTLYVHAPNNLPALPAAVETAIYRIALEAVTNVIHHAGARVCTITIALEHAGERGAIAHASRQLRLSVEDDGRGISPDAIAGVGLRSMNERAEEIGGSLSITSQPGVGVRIEATTPIAATSSPTPLSNTV